MDELLAAYGLRYIPEKTVEQPSFNNENQSFNLANALKNMPPEQRDTFLSNLVKNLELNFDYSKFGDKYTSGSQYGGRVGYNMPLSDENKIRFGISGSGQSVNTPGGTFSNKQITGADIGYSFGPNDISMSYIPMGGVPLARIPSETNPRDMSITTNQVNDEFLGMPVKNFLQLLYRRQF